MADRTPQEWMQYLRNVEESYSTSADDCAAAQDLLVAAWEDSLAELHRLRARVAELEAAVEVMECCRCGAGITGATAMRSAPLDANGVPVHLLMCMDCFVAHGGQAPPDYLDTLTEEGA